MGSKERRERERAELKGRILEAARELFVAHGFEAVSMRKIAERIEYSPTAIYLHFKDKEELLRALCDGDFLALAEKVQGIFALADPIEKLKELGRAYIRFAVEHPAQYRFMFMTPPPPGLKATEVSTLEKGNPAQDSYAGLKLVVTEALAAGRFRPEHDDVEELTQVLWGSLHGIVSLHLIFAHDDWIDWQPLEATTERLMNVLLRGLLKPEA